MMRSWIRNVFTRPVRKAPRRTRPAVETLEGRLVPTTFTVSRLADDAAAGSLRWAITQANTVAGDDIINFSVTGTINLGGVLPDLNSNIDIQGPGAGSLTVRRDTGGDYGIFRIPAGRTVALSGLTIANALVPIIYAGGGILNAGTLTVSNCTLSGNFGGFLGGAISNTGTLTVSNSTLSGNSAQFGGGIHNEGEVTVSNSTLSNNSLVYSGNGGGIFNQGTLTVSNSTFSGNSALPDGYGGGIYHDRGALTVSNSTLSGNRARSGQGGGIFRGGFLGTVILNNSLVVNSPLGGDVVGQVPGSNNLTGAVALGPLQNNGGPTPTHALPAGSPALNAGSNALIPPGVTTDQRGPGFVRVFGGTVDIGAFEVQLRTLTWTGAGANANWTTSANWQGSLTPAPGDDLVFPAGAARPSNSNTLPVDTAFRSLTLSGAGYTLGGNGLALTNGLTAAAAGANTVAVNLTLGGTQGLTAGAGAQLTLSGGVSAGALTKGGAGQLTVASPLAAASFTMTAGTVHIPATGYVYAAGNYVQTAGRTTLNGGGIWVALTDLQGGILDGSGWLYGHLRNAARIDIGGAGAAGYLNVLGGNYTQTAAGVLNVELAGPDIATQYDFFYVEGTATLAGTLNLSRLGGYVPALDDFFYPLYSVGLSSGTFATITGLTLSPTRALGPYYYANGLILYVYAT